MMLRIIINSSIVFFLLGLYPLNAKFQSDEGQRKVELYMGMGSQPCDSPEQLPLCGILMVRMKKIRVWLSPQDERKLLWSGKALRRFFLHDRFFHLSLEVLYFSKRQEFRYTLTAFEEGVAGQFRMMVVRGKEGEELPKLEVIGPEYLFQGKKYYPAFSLESRGP